MKTIRNTSDSDYIEALEHEKACPFYSNEKWHCFKANRRIGVCGCHPNGLICEVFRTWERSFFDESAYREIAWISGR